ncbi:MAG: hypothetical protein HY735_12700 [Verrucomicrobia bacterium]|nr:hypothetical protein [Verrucomicrobiota bacterium]
MRKNSSQRFIATRPLATVARLKSGSRKWWLLAAAIAAPAASSVRAATPTLTPGDVGYPSLAGSTTIAGGKITIVGGGNDIWNTSDNFHYAYFKATGDFDYVVKVEDLQGPDNWSKAELMARRPEVDVPQGGDPHISNMTTRSGGQNQLSPQWRVNRDGASDWRSPTGTPRPTYPNTWLRMERVGSAFYLYYSSDGKVWKMYEPNGKIDTAGSSPPGADNGTFFSEAWPDAILLGLAVTAHNDADANGATAVFSGFDAYVPVPIAITTQPAASVSVTANKPLTLSVAATGDPLHYQWRKDGKDIAGATASTFSVAVAKASDAGTYTARLYGGGKEVISANSVVTVTQDTEPPRIASVTGDVSFTAVTVTFSEPVAASAENTANYAFDKNITVNSVTRIDPYKVSLATSRMADGTDYTLTVNGVLDTASPANVIAANSKLTFKSWIYASGVVMHKFWENNTANNIAGLTNRADFPNAPTRITMEPMWEYGPNGVNESGSNYGNQLIGWFSPARSGNYVFFTNSDDPSRLYLSTDDNPANKKLIAAETGWSNARNWVSVGSGDVTSKRSDQYASTEWPTGNTITLQTGRRYYMESLHTEGGGGDSVAATFIMEGDADPANTTAPALSGALIGTYMDPNGASITISQQPKNATAVANATATFTVEAAGTSVYGTTLTYQWQKAAPGSTTFTAIDRATAASYTTPFLAAANNGEKYRVVISRPPISETSAEALLTITADTVPPTIASIAGNPTQLELTLHFSEPLDNASATAVANYAFDKGLTVSAAVLKNQTDVVLTTSQQTGGTQYSLTVNNVKDVAGNAVATNTKLTFYPATVATGAVAYWNFDGDLKDWIKDFDGTARGLPPIPFVDGKPGFGKAIKLDGGTQYVEITGGEPDDLAFVGGSMSVAAWFKVDTFDTSWQALVAKGEGGNWRIHRRSGEEGMAYTGGPSGDTPSGVPVNDGQWHHLVAITDKDAVAFGTALYIDGVLDTQLAAAQVLASNGRRVRIGDNPDAPSREWEGEIDDVAIWNRVLLPAEISQLYAGGTGKPLGTFLPPPAGEPVSVKVSRSGGALTILWSPAGGTLEVSPALGPTANWTAVGAANPATITIGGGAAYYRVRK